MFIKKIEICGFKSFAGKTVFEFNSEEDKAGQNKKQNIACIVGPNGSGKSNVADALRWVIGEQSVKNIRSKKSEDVIFAGSKKKAKLGSAVVSVYFDNSDKKINIEYPEVIITRKFFRNGENNYFVNGSKVRLSYVEELLAQAGVGRGSYAIINQGMADRVLLATPQERKKILEDAAGVKEFQIKKTGSLRKIAKTKENLIKVKESLNEELPRLKMLERQKNKIEKSRGLIQELKDKKICLYSSWRSKLAGEIKEKEEELGKISDRIEKSKQNIFKLKNNLSQSSGTDNSTGKRIRELQKEKGQVEEEEYKLRKNISILEGKIEIERQKIQALKKPEFIPVDKEFTLNNLKDIKKDYLFLQSKIESAEESFNMKSFQKLIEKTRFKLETLIEGIKEGKVKKKNSEEEFKKEEAKLKNEIKKYQDKIEELKNKSGKNAERVKEINSLISQLQSGERERKEKEWQDREKLQREEFEIEKASGYKNHLENLLKDKKTKQQEIDQKVFQELGKKPEELPEIQQETDLVQLEKQIEKIHWQLEQIGGIDESVVEEFEYVSQRYEFLKKEASDLENTLEKLQEVVKEMDIAIKSRFKEAFREVDKSFGRYFKSIFGGGEASLQKVYFPKEGNEEEEEEFEKTGIEIKVSPPGKRIESLNMLSGGERSLTSIALLFAIIDHNPPPFVFMDEVEANLDEANSKRFGRALKKLALKTQFILATHNKQTMKEASFLYGVTMQEDGCSKVYSLKLEA
ncbi:MAG: AAA family ATPase [Patescibacteria group bacterium]